MLDIKKIRDDFPILDKKILDNKDLIYLDTAASAQKPKVVIDEINSFYSNNYANVSRGVHTLSVESTFKYEDARKKVQKFINADSEREIIFTKSATESINLLANSFALKYINEGDEIILTVMEHHSNIIPWFLIRDRYKCNILFANIDSTGNIDQKHFESLISEKTKLVSITHLSNVFGTIVNQDIVNLCNKAGIPILLDGCQSAAHIPIDVKALGCDYYVFSGHKLYAPTGVGVFYGRENLIEELPPYQGGGGMIADVSTDGATFTDLPAKFEAGTPPLVEAYGLGVAIDYVTEIGMSEISEHELKLTNYALHKMKELDFVDIHGANGNKHSIISFNIKNIHSHEVSSFLDVEGVAIRAGHHCCQPLMKHLSLNSTARVSFGVYNTENEIDTFISALKKCRDFFTK
ncbi:MAG: SufS family cysteine desulfurase [Pelagibacterales bacterium]|nr:SufS family cysteine desulfurase [Pelagibacterales bacterium]